MTLGEALDFLFQCHRGAPFLFFNAGAELIALPESLLREKVPPP